MKVKKKVTSFLKKRICPVLIALVIVFFSVVIPCAKVEASSIVVPAPTAGFTYYDLVSTAFLSTGFDCPLEKSDGTRTTFGQEMYDELCDTFELWCNDNFGTTDADLIKDQLRALPGAIANGAITIGKDLWSALKGFASSAYNYVSTHFMEDDTPYLKNGLYTWSLIKCICGSIPGFADESSTFATDFYGGGNYYILLGRQQGNDYVYQLGCSNDPYYTFDNSGYFYRSSGSSWSDFSCYYWCKNESVWKAMVGSTSYPCSVICTNMIYVADRSLSNWKDVADANKDLVWPKQDLGVDKVANPTWDDAITAPDVIVVEGEDAITIPLVNTGEDSAVIPGTAVDNPAVDDPAVDDPAVDNPADEAVSSDDIAALPDKIASAGDVTTLFPFCIPFDIVALIKGMKAEKEVPVWEFKYHFEAIDYTFEVTIDMTDYEAYVKIFRSGFVIFYIIALMLFTIRYSSGIVKD